MKSTRARSYYGTDGRSQSATGAVDRIRVPPDHSPRQVGAGAYAATRYINRRGPEGHAEVARYPSRKRASVPACGFAAVHEQHSGPSNSGWTHRKRVGLENSRARGHADARCSDGRSRRDQTRARSTHRAIQQREKRVRVPTTRIGNDPAQLASAGDAISLHPRLAIVEARAPSGYSASQEVGDGLLGPEARRVARLERL